MPGDRRRHLRPNPHTLGVEVLADDEVSLVMRMRGPRKPLEQFALMTAAERGALITEALARR